MASKYCVQVDFLKKLIMEISDYNIIIYTVLKYSILWKINETNLLILVNDGFIEKKIMKFYHMKWIASRNNNFIKLKYLYCLKVI